MPNSVDPDETAHYDLCCLQMLIIVDYGNERVKGIIYFMMVSRQITDRTRLMTRAYIVHTQYEF